VCTEKHFRQRVKACGFWSCLFCWKSSCTCRIRGFSAWSLRHRFSSVSGNKVICKDVVCCRSHDTKYSAIDGYWINLYSIQLEKVNSRYT
jgi:hypothetical protein